MAILEVERIGSEIFLPGTIAKLENEQIQLDRLHSTGVAASQEDLVRLIDAGADKMIGNVDPFLDEYYTLFAEYARLTAMLTADLEDKLTEDLRV